jgi:exopolyphosphatase/guanosine-5'-triphosphate,3'-diphosphate pyrophosphatase
MQPARRAVIDVGTNSIKLLVANVAGFDVQAVHEESRQTRLGWRLYETHQLQLEPVAYSANAVADFAAVARKHGAQSIRVIATSAAREAVNAGDLASAIEASSGLKVEIISGGQEAAWTFHGVTADKELALAPLLLLDVGGGSTEFTLGSGGRMHFARSFSLGAVRLLEKFPVSDPPARGELTACRAWVSDFLQTEVRPKLEPGLRRETGSSSGKIQLVGTGGTAGILARIEAKLDHYDREKIEAVRLGLARVREQRRRLWRLPLAERKEIPGLPKPRADVILFGVLIYEVLMEEFGFKELRISTRGLRFAALMG